jgi:FMN hydrolase / 5-amino-6-(5-phospho-D-ribitylamino)uracil phosphatase
MLRVVAFDVDGTLVDLLPAIRGGLEAALVELRRLSPAAAGLTVADLQDDCWRAEARLPAGSPVTEVRRAGFERTLRRLGLDRTLLDGVCDLFFDRRYSLIRLYDDVRPALAALRPSYVLGVGTNGNSHAARCGLAGEFAFEVYAHVDGVPAKPHPDFFARLVEAAGTPPAGIVYVGDSLDQDVVPARAAGLRTVWLDRAGAGLPPGYEPDAVVRSLTYLPVVLAHLPLQVS